MRFARFPILALIFLAGGTMAAHAEDTLGIVTGPRTGTYIAIGHDIAAVARQAGIMVEVKASDGSVENIRRLTSRENVELGIVQSDVLSFLRRSQNPATRKMASELRMVMPLYAEEVHVLARNDIASFHDLEGKRVVVGEDGSGDMLTAINLLAMTGVTPSETIRKPPPEGVLALLDHQADAVFIVGGKPMKLFQNLSSLQNEQDPAYQKLLTEVHFLPLNDPRMLEEYRQAEITPAAYPFVTEKIPTIAATAVLVTFDFSTPGRHHAERCREVRAVTQALVSHLDWLKAHGHAKWKEVSPDASPPLWRKDACAWGNVKEKHMRKHVHRHAKHAAAHVPSVHFSRDMRQAMNDR